MAEHDQQFASKQEWVDKGQSWLTRHPMWGDYFKAICFDAKGRYVGNGGDFRRAEEDSAFPVRWLWPDQVGQMATLNAEMLDGLKRVVSHLAAWADDHADEATAETWAALHCARETIAKAEARP